MPESETAAPLLTERFRRAFDLAFETHWGQLRKCTAIPYIAHLMSVSALVLEHGGLEDAAIGGLLHDAIEDSKDGKAMEGRIREEYGDRVADIVMGCSDAVAVPEQKKPPWRERKEKYLEHLCHVTDDDILLVSACDKLHNARAIASDLRLVGEKLWSKFSAGRVDQLWYYGALVEIYEKKTPADAEGTTGRRTVVDEFARVVEEIRIFSA